MERDTAALEAVAAGNSPGVVRVYGFAPACLSLGRLQDETDVDWEACHRDGIHVVRRPTGGRAVLHDAEVTYSVVCRNDDADFGGDVLTSCARIHLAVAAGLARLGIATTPVARHVDERREARARVSVADCFARPSSHELVDHDLRKLVGSAQARRGDALLQHGSVLLDPPQAVGYVTREATGEGEGVQERGRVRQATVGIRALLSRDVSFEELRSALVAGFSEYLGARLHR